MRHLVPYLNFAGRCEEALSFYQGCFGDAEVSIRRFSDMPDMDLPEAARALVMHAEFKSEGFFIMATDGQPDTPFDPGNNVHLNIAFDDLVDQKRVFDGLSQGGTVTMPLQDTFWSSRFGMLTDKFGIQWMLNVPIKPE